jgi:hypothetical protein
MDRTLPSASAMAVVMAADPQRDRTNRSAAFAHQVVQRLGADLAGGEALGCACGAVEGVDASLEGAEQGGAADVG